MARFRLYTRFSILACTAFLACGSPSDSSVGAARVPRYRPVSRAVTITTVPLLAKEQRATFPFLRSDFAKGGVLDGKEVYAFSPSTVTVVEADTIAFTFINPEDDVHSFVLPDFSVSLPPQRTTTATYVARHAGIYSFTCAIASHLPMMWGQLVVLAPAAVSVDTAHRVPEPSR